ncbi:MAG: sulfotransferase domain-containing protein [Anaerolineae bacterium]|nr:sulfotransferase domain-containing protein [Anaerolineae bacterium]
MTFFINRIKQKVRGFISAQLNPIQSQLERVQAQNSNILQLLQLIGGSFTPPIAIDLSNIGLGDGATVVSPNYHNLLREDDIFLLSYPRSGNTWLRAIIAYTLYHPHILNSLKDLDEYVPDLHVGLPNHQRYSSPRILKSHYPYSMRHVLDNPALYKRYIYIIRHPYKVIESYYHFERHRLGHNVMELKRFVDLVVNNAYHYGGWKEHILSWEYARQYADDTLFIRYEDLIQSPITYIQKIGYFLGQTTSIEQAQAIKQFSSQENMRELDNKGQIIQGFEMVRQGENRKLDDKLSDELKGYIYKNYREVMFDWGYEENGTTQNEYPRLNWINQSKGREDDL